MGHEVWREPLSGLQGRQRPQALRRAGRAAVPAALAKCRPHATAVTGSQSQSGSPPQFPTRCTTAPRSSRTSGQVSCDRGRDRGDRKEAGPRGRRGWDGARATQGSLCAEPAPGGAVALERSAPPARARTSARARRAPRPESAARGRHRPLFFPRCRRRPRRHAARSRAPPPSWENKRARAKSAY